MDAALAPSTAAAYRRTWHLLQVFVARHPHVLFPVSVGELADFLGERFASGCCSSTLASITSAVAFAHRIRGLPDPTGDFRIRTMLNGSRRLRPSQDHRMALAVADIKRLCGKLDLPLDPITRAAFRAAFPLAFFAMLRPSEVAVGATSLHTIKFGGVRLLSHLLEVTVPSSKTSLNPSTIHLEARPDVVICPVAAMRRYLAVRGIGSSTGVLFLDGRQRPITTRSLTRTLKQAGQLAGLDPRCLSSHCLRIGGASHGAEVGLSELQLAQAGRWASMGAMRRYLRRPVSLLQATPSDHVTRRAP